MKKFILISVLASLALASCGTLEITLDDTPTPRVDTPTVKAVIPPDDTPLPPLPTETAQPISTEPVPELTLVMLQNAEYHSITLDGDEANFRLEDGLYYLPEQSQGWSGNWFVRMLNRTVFGDLNDDGVQDAVVVFESQRGGSGLFRELAAVLNRNGQPVNIATAYLGDRVIVNSVQIQDGLILVDMLIQGPYDAMLYPTVRTTLKYQLIGMDLTTIN